MTVEKLNAIRKAIVDFDWSNYGLDELHDASPEYAEALAKSVLEILKEDLEEHDKFVVECSELVPEGYDGDESAESIVLKYLREMDALGGIIARLTSAYR